MIQAPQLQYIPAQQAMPMNYQPQGATQAVQYQQTPGYYYNYPTTSCYAQPAAKSQFNGVNIEIINPQGQATAPNYGYAMPAQYMPVQQAPIMMPAMPQPFPASQAIVNAPAMPQAPVAQVPAMPQAPAVAYEAPQVAPQVVPQVAPQAAAPVAVPQPQIETPAATATTPATEPAVPQNTGIDPQAFAGKLNSADLDAQKATIEEIATLVKTDKTAGPVLLDTQIFDALVGIINKDTSTLQGPTPEVIELRQKPQEQLSAADLAKATTPSELEKAEINKQYALYTIAYMQERLNNELEARNGQTLELKDLPCIENVVETVKSNPNPTLRMSGIAALSHIAKPQYKADLTQVFELAKADEDARVKDAATKAIANLK